MRDSVLLSPFPYDSPPRNIPSTRRGETLALCQKTAERGSSNKEREQQRTHEKSKGWQRFGKNWDGPESGRQILGNFCGTVHYALVQT